MVERVIVAVDGGPASRAALDWTLARARTVPVHLELTTVVDLGWSPVRGPDDDFQPAYERALADAAAYADRAGVGVKTTSIVRRGSPVDELVRASSGAELLVVGTNKTGVLVGAVHGTLPLRLAAHARCPVVVVPAGWSDGGNCVVVGVEDDATVDAPLAAAAAEAEALGLPLVLVHAWSRLIATSSAEPSTGSAPRTPVSPSRAGWRRVPRHRRWSPKPHRPPCWWWAPMAAAPLPA